MKQFLLRLRNALFVVAALLALIVTLAPAFVRAQQCGGGAFILGCDYTSSGKWTFTNAVGPVMTAPTLTAPAISAPVFSGSASGTYTLAGTPTITAPTISAPVFSGSATGTYTLAGTPTITSPTITGPTISGAALSSGNYIGYPAVQTSASLGGSPVTLTAAQCGQAFSMDAATGIVYIMPSTFPTAGCTYDFIVDTTVTSNAHEIESGNAAHFLKGTIVEVTATATARADTCDGTSHIAYKMLGTTTGGLIGTHIRVTVVSATVARLDGLAFGSGTLATACSASN